MTPHIESKLEDIAKTVIMPGDPLRAKMIAETYLENPKLVNSLRNILAYTGTYKGKPVTVFSSGMGNPSMGIYAYELFKFYNVENIIRVGTCGSYKEDLDLYENIIVTGSYSTSSFAYELNENKNSIIYSNQELNEKLKNASSKLNMHYTVGLIHSTDVFYKENNNYKELVEKYNVLGAEMETFALFSIASMLNKKATCILTVSDSLVTHKETTSEERQNSFHQMIKIALESIIL